MDYGNYFGRMNAPMVRSSNPTTPITPSTISTSTTASPSMDRNKITSQSHPDFSTNFNTSSSYFPTTPNVDDSYGNFYASSTRVPTTPQSSFRRIFFQESTTPATPPSDPYLAQNQQTTKEEILKRVQSEDFIRHMNTSYKRTDMDVEVAVIESQEHVAESLKNQYYSQKFQTQASNFY